MVRLFCPRSALPALIALLLLPASASALTLLPEQAVPSSLADPTLSLDENGTAYLVGLDGLTSIAPFGGTLGTPERLLAIEPRPWEAVSGVSAGGELSVVYTRSANRAHVHRRVRVVVRAVSGAISAPVTISQTGRTADTPALAVGADGEAIAAFVRHDADARWHVQYAVRQAGQASFGPPHTVPGTDGIVARGTRIDVAVRPGGGGVLTWATRPVSRSVPGSLMALVADRDGTGAPVRLQKTAAVNSYGIPHARTAIAYGPDGSGVIAWVRPSSATDALGGDTIVAATLSDRGIGDAKVLASYAGPLVGWAATADSRGAATVVWASYPGYGADTGDVTATVRTRSRAADGTWSGATALSNPKVYVSPAGGRRPGLIAVGTSSVLSVWGEQSRYSSIDTQLRLSTRTPAGTWTPVQPLTPVTGGTLPAAAVSPSGRLAVIWMTGPAAPGTRLVFGTLG